MLNCLTQLLSHRPLAISATLCLLLVASGAAAQQTSSVPAYVNYQGRITDALGKPATTGDYTLTFRIWDAASAGNLVWGPQVFDGSSAQGHGGKVPVVQGHFNVVLGPTDVATTPAGGRSIVNAFSQGVVRFVEIQVGTSAPISPRQQILTTPYAAIAANGNPVGAVIPFAGSSPPPGYLLCDGGEYATAEFPALGAALGGNFCGGNAAACSEGKFRVPDLRGYTVIGFGRGSSTTTDRRFGEKVGKEAISVDAMPAHNHVSASAVQPSGGTAAGGPVGKLDNPGCKFGGGECGTHYAYGGYYTTNTGGSNPDGNMQPSIALLYVIKY